MKLIFFFMSSKQRGEDFSAFLQQLSSLSFLLFFFRKDSFTVTCGTYLGRLTKIKIDHDNSGLGAVWFLDKVRRLIGERSASKRMCSSL